MVNAVRSIGNAVSNTVSNVGSTVSNAVHNVGNATGINQGLTGIGGVMGNVGQGVSDLYSRGYRPIENAVNNVGRGLENAVNQTGAALDSVLGGGQPAPAGGGGSSAGLTTYTTNLPEYARPVAEKMFGRAEALSEQKYQPYQNERIAGFTDLQNSAFQGANQLGPAAQTGQGTDFASRAGLAGLAAGDARFPQAVSQYMSPYMQNVVDMQQRDAQRNADIASTQRNAKAVQAGAFGGSRQAIMDAEAGRNLALQKGDIAAKGYQDAFTQAGSLFNQDMNRAIAGSQAGNQAAGTLGQLGAQQFGMDKDSIAMRNAFGTQQQQQEQNRLNQQYQDFQNQQAWDYKQMGFLSDLLRGTPGSQSAQQVFAPQPSTLSQVAGIGTQLAGLMGMAKAKGGEIKAYAAGGDVSAGTDPSELLRLLGQLSDQQLEQVAQTGKYPQEIIGAEMRRRQEMRSSGGLGALATVRMNDGGSVTDAVKDAVAKNWMYAIPGMAAVRPPQVPVAEMADAALNTVLPPKGATPPAATAGKPTGVPKDAVVDYTPPMTIEQARAAGLFGNPGINPTARVGTSAGAGVSSRTTTPQMADIAKLWQQAGSLSGSGQPVADDPRLAEINKMEMANAEAAMQDIIAEQARRDPYYAKRVAAIDAQEAALEKDKQRALYEAMFIGGGAMASTPGSILSALNAGLGVGGKHYMSEGEKRRAAKAGIQQKREAFEDTKFAADNQMSDAQRQARAGKREVGVTGAKRQYEYGQNEKTRLDAQRKALFEAGVQQADTQQKIAAQLRAASIGSGAGRPPSDVMQLAERIRQEHMARTGQYMSQEDAVGRATTALNQGRIAQAGVSSNPMQEMLARELGGSGGVTLPPLR